MEYDRDLYGKILQNLCITGILLEKFRNIANIYGVESNMSSQNVMTSPQKRPKLALPYAFTEHGAVMLASVLHSPCAVQMSVMVTRAFIAMRNAIATMLSVDLKMEQLSHKVDQLNAYIEEILHDQNNINEQQEQTNLEIAVQIEALNDALDQLRETKNQPRKRIGYKPEEGLADL